MEFNKVLENRIATRNFDPEFKLTNEEIAQLITQATTAPSAINLQPWRFIVINNDATKTELTKLVRDTKIIEDSSAVIIVVCNKHAWKNGDEIIQASVDAGKMPIQAKEFLGSMIATSYGALSDEALHAATMYDCGLVSMQLMLAATNAGYDTLALGGFDRKTTSEHLNLKNHEYPAIFIPIGRALTKNSKDKVRFDIKTIIEYK